MTDLDRGNIDRAIVDDFGREWGAFDQTAIPANELEWRFDSYFSMFHFDKEAEGFDLGCGSGRWARGVAPRVGILHCIDPAVEALEVARRALAELPNVTFDQAGADSIPLADSSQDFGYALGVLHHIPDTARAMRDCVAKLKPGGQFLVYLYYRFDSRPAWFRAVWRLSEVGRRTISRMPFALKKPLTTLIAASVYYPLARSAWLLDRIGVRLRNLPLYEYRDTSFYTMRTDALDRFGTKLEHRFTQPEIAAMMRKAGLRDIRFSDAAPFWVAHGIKA